MRILMHWRRAGLALAAAGAWAAGAAADTHYVALNNPGAESNYTSWATAAANIQDAVDAAAAADVVLVSNGVYNAGGRTEGAYTLTNRVVIIRAIELRAVSTNPADTVIEGAADLDGINGNGPAAVRAVRVTVVGAKLNNFTIRNGHTQTNGDVTWEQSGGGILSHWLAVSNCVISNCGARANGGGFTYGYLYDSLVVNNQADGVGAGTVYGGGGMYNCQAYHSEILYNRSLKSGGGIAIGTVISNCTLAGNIATNSGGGYYAYNQGGLIVDSVISNNSVGSYGGGAYNTKVLRCQVVGNSAGNGGGGISVCYATNTVIYGNTAGFGGAIAGTTAANAYPIYNCLIYGNTAESGGAVRYALPVNCTIVSNIVETSGGAGLDVGVIATNCIVYENRTAGVISNYSGTVQFKNCNVWPLPTGGSDLGGNVSNAPAFMNFNGADFRLAPRCPCINAGFTESWMTNTVDLDGRPRVRYGVVDMGCYEHIMAGTIYTFR